MPQQLFLTSVRSCGRALLQLGGPFHLQDDPRSDLMAKKRALQKHLVTKGVKQLGSSKRSKASQKHLVTKGGGHLGSSKRSKVARVINLLVARTVHGKTRVAAAAVASSIESVIVGGSRRSARGLGSRSFLKESIGSSVSISPSSAVMPSSSGFSPSASHDAHAPTLISSSKGEAASPLIGKSVTFRNVDPAEDAPKGILKLSAPTTIFSLADEVEAAREAKATVFRAASKGKVRELLLTYCLNRTVGQMSQMTETAFNSLQKASHDAMAHPERLDAFILAAHVALGPLLNFSMISDEKEAVRILHEFPMLPALAGFAKDEAEVEEDMLQILNLNGRSRLHLSQYMDDLDRTRIDAILKGEVNRYIVTRESKCSDCSE